MTDDALKRAFRQLTAGESAIGGLTSDGKAPAAADSLVALVSGDHAEAERDAHLAAVAESALNADLLRALRALASDANALSANVQQLNGQTRARPAPTPRPALRPARWYALAASVALAGVVGLVLKATVSLDSAQPGQGSSVAAGTSPAFETSNIADGGKIMMASFEDNAASAGSGSSKPTIFVGDFDS